MNREELNPVPAGAADSAWFWMSTFCMGALAALVLTGPKFSWRQPQIERQYQARQQSGHSVQGRNDSVPEAVADRPMITLSPLFVLISAGLFVSWSMWLRQRFLARRKAFARTDHVDS